MTTAAKDARSGRGALIGLAALFFLPLAAAFWLYYAGGWRPAGSTNNGELITPARPLPDSASLRGKWTLVYIGDGACAEGCRKALWTMRQTRLLLAEDMDRVQRVFVAETGCCDRAFLDAEHPGLRVATPAEAAAKAWLAEFPRTPGRESLYIVDPLGNLMMRFDLAQDPKGLKSDLEKLLKLSHIG
jgi:hypothetical protein